MQVKKPQMLGDYRNNGRAYRSLCRESSDYSLSNAK